MLTRHLNLTDAQTGVFAATGAYLLWGFSPLFYRLLGEASALEILGHRTLWSLLFTAILVHIGRQSGLLKKVFSDRRLLLTLSISAVMVAINWLTFIWAVNNDKALEASMGYFIMPIVMVVLGRIFLAEQMNRLQLAAVVMVCMGMFNLLLTLGQFPWIALIIAITLGLYGLVRKTASIDSLTGLTVECLLLSPAAIIYFAFIAFERSMVFGTLGMGFDLLLASSALMTAVPLILFTIGTRRLRFSTAGMLQYINPTCQFLLAVLLFREPFTSTHLTTFLLIWSGLILYSYNSLRRQPATVKQ